MTRKEITGFRDLTFSDWIRRNLPDSSTGYCASDLDFILWNWKEKTLIILEIKCYNCKPKMWQEIMWQNINKWIAKGIDSNWTYKGYHLIQFEATNFNNGKCFLDGEEISETDLANYLSFKSQ